MLDEIGQMFVRGKEIKCKHTGANYIVVYQSIRRSDFFWR